MKYLFQYIDENINIIKVIGTVIEEDNDHFDRIEHFFKKHGFTVEFYTNNKGKKIRECIGKNF